MPARLPAYQQREKLIQAAFELAEKQVPERITARALVSGAGVPAGSITQQFGDLDRLVTVLQSLHYEAMRAHVLAAISGQQPGVERILKATQAYLDFAFSRRGLRRWASAVRLRSADMQSQWKLDNRLYMQFAASEFALSGWPHPEVGARLFIAGVIELARYEQSENRKMPASRRTLERFLRTFERMPVLV
jgi:AcrR family transcriptional regulator